MSLAHRVIPCLLVDGDRFVKTRRFADAEYVGDPVNVLSIFNSFEVDEIVILDIAAARTRDPTDTGTLRLYATECFIPLAYGGGMTSLTQMEQVFAAGYEKVVLNTVLRSDPAVVEAAAGHFGSQAITASIDVRGGDSGSWQVCVRGGSEPTGSHPVEWARRAEELGAGEILLTSVDREGTMSGFDLELCAAVSQAVDVPVIAHGGAGKRKHLADPIRHSGASAVGAGSLFVFQGLGRGVLINYPNRSQIERLVAHDRQHRG